MHNLRYIYIYIYIYTCKIYKRYNNIWFIFFFEECISGALWLTRGGRDLKTVMTLQGGFHASHPARLLVPDVPLEVMGSSTQQVGGTYLSFSFLPLVGRALDCNVYFHSKVFNFFYLCIIIVQKAATDYIDKLNGRPRNCSRKTE